MKRLHKSLLMPWAGGSTAMVYTNKVIALSPIAYWPMAESSGVVALDASGNARNGAYSNVTLGATGIGDGRTAASFNGSTSFNNVFGASLAGAFNGEEGSLHLWIQVSGAGVWSDSTVRGLAYFQADANNRVTFDRLSTANQVRVRYTAGATSKTVTITPGPSTAWIALGMTWSKAADQVIAYLNGAQSGTTQTGLGAFAGTLNSTATLLGAINTTPTSVWSGNLAHAAVWNTPLNATQMLTLATVP